MPTDSLSLSVRFFLSFFVLARVSAFEAVPEGEQRRHFVGCEQQGSAEEGEAGEVRGG